MKIWRCRFVSKTNLDCEVVSDTFGIMLGLTLLFSATFNNILFIYRGDQLYWWSKQDYTKKTTDLPQIPNKLYRIMLYRVHLAWEGFELTTLVVICTDSIGSCKLNYHTITITMVGPYCMHVSQGTLYINMNINISIFLSNTQR
jgi:hypothetical protein